MPVPPGIPEDAEDVSLGGFNKFVGPLYRLPDDGERTRFAFAVADKHMNAAGTVHGGMLMSLADVSMSRTSRDTTKAESCSTVALSCDFLAPGRLGDVIESRVRVTRRTRTLVFLSAEVSAGGRLLLTASGVWKLGAAR
jgi:uncharacterized protein (TIGR00369 family)